MSSATWSQFQISAGLQLSKIGPGAVRTPQCLCFYFYWKCQEAMQYASGEEAQAVLGVIFFLFAGFIGALPRGGLPCGCALCACVCSLTLCLDEMEYLCRDLSCIFHVPRHEIPIHSFQLPQQHHYLGVTGNAGEDTQKDMITFRRNSNLWASPCAFGDRTNNDNLNIPWTDFKF